MSRAGSDITFLHRMAKIIFIQMKKESFQMEGEKFSLEEKQYQIISSGGFNSFPSQIDFLIK